MASTTNPELYAIIVGKKANELRARMAPSWVSAVHVTHESEPHIGRRVLYVHVRFELLAQDMARPSFNWSPDMEPRLRSILQIKEWAPKSIRMDRRLLNARASHARRTKPRKTSQ